MKTSLLSKEGCFCKDLRSEFSFYQMDPLEKQHLEKVPSVTDLWETLGQRVAGPQHR